MKVYKVVFVPEEINSCKKISDESSAYSSYHYEHAEGTLIYAVIKEDSEARTHATALNIIRQAGAWSGTRKFVRQ